MGVMNKNDQTIMDLHMVRGLLKDPRNFTRQTMARDAAGNPVHALDPAAVCWCLTGACLKIAGGDFARFDPMIDELVKVTPGSFVQLYADTHQLAEVLDVLDHAIGAPA